MPTKVTYYSDFRNLSSITSPMINNGVGMRYSGTFLESNNRSFLNPYSGLKKNKYNKGVIYCNDSSLLFSMSKGHVGISLQLNDDVISGVYSPVANKPYEYLIWGINVGKIESSYPSIFAKLTKDGIKFTVLSSFGQYSIIDNITNIPNGEMAYFEFIWDAERIYNSKDYSIGIPNNILNESSMSSNDMDGFWATMCIKVNGYPTVSGNPPICANDSLSGIKFCLLDTLYNQSNLECTIGKLFIANGFIEEGISEYDSSSSSYSYSSQSMSHSSLSSFSYQSKSSNSSKSTYSSESSPSNSSSSSSTLNKWNITNTIYDFIPTSMASSNNNSYIYVVGSNATSNQSYCVARMYRSTDRNNFIDITTNTGIDTEADIGTRFYEIKCDDSGKTILLGQQGLTKWTNYPSNPAVFSNSFGMGKILLSQDYGNTWSTIVCDSNAVSDVSVATTDYTMANSLCVTPDGQTMAITANNVYTGEARIFTYQSGNWEKKSSSSNASTPIFVNGNEMKYYWTYATDAYFSKFDFMSFDSLNLGDTAYSKVNMVHIEEGSGSLYDNYRGLTYAGCVSDDMYHAIMLGYYELGYYDLYWHVIAFAYVSAACDAAIVSTDASSIYFGIHVPSTLYSQIICDSNCSTVFFADKTNGLYKKSGTSWSFQKMIGPNMPANPRCISGTRSLSNVCAANISSSTSCYICYR